ncbi:MAG: LysR family transcriptional regulator, partial [bacterium]|nr:LysR family transcriptional regulator [bacterium]
MLDLNKARTFYWVVKMDGITAAEKILGIKQSSITKQLQSLEESEGKKLLTSSAKGVILTPEGEYLFHFAERIVMSSHNYEDGQPKDEKSELTLATTYGTASEWLIRILPEWVETHPHITLNVITYSNDFEIMRSNFDVGLSPLQQNHSFLKKHMIGHFNFRLYASPDYIKKYGYLKNLNDLKNHKLITFSRNDVLPYNRIDAISGKPKNVIMSIMSSTAAARLAEHGMGIAILGAESYSATHLNLVDIYPDSPPHALKT